MKIRKIFLAIVLFILCLPVTNVHASANILNNITMNIFINQDGSATIDETWTGGFYEGTEIYKAWYNMRGSTVSDLSVVDETGKLYQTVDWDIDASFEEKKDKCGIIENEKGYELCVGIGSYGRHSYTMTYTIHDFIVQYEGSQGFNYRLISDGMDPSPLSVDITISSKRGFTAENTRIYGYGYKGSVEFDGNGNIVMNCNGLMNYMNILSECSDQGFVTNKNVDKTFEEVLEDANNGSDYDIESSDPFSTKILVGFAVVTIGILSFTFSLIFYYRRKIKKNNELHFVGDAELNTSRDNYFREIPCNGDVFYFYYLAKKVNIIKGNDANSGLLSALLLKWIREGRASFSREEGTGFFKKDEFEIAFDKTKIPTDNPLESKAYLFFVEASGDNIILEDKEFKKWCRKNYSELNAWFTKVDTACGNNLESAGHLHNGTNKIKILFFNFPFSHITYDLKVKKDMEQVIGFKNFLEEFSLVEEKEVIEVALWEEYLIFASVLSLSDKVQKQLKEFCPEFNQQSTIDYNYSIYASHMFCRAGVMSASSASASANSRSSGGGGSSSFGGGGGGLSGGGGGGVR